MKITDLKIGDHVCCTHDKFPMVVVGLHALLDDIEKGRGTAYLDFEGNEADPWEVELPDEELEFANDTK